jgi:hypothetical protein
MRIQVGSKVKFLNDVGGGIVKSFVGEKMALVETDDGFEMSVLVTELLPDATASYELNSGKTLEKRESKAADETPKKPVATFEEKRYAVFKGEVFLAIVPHNENVLHVSNFGLFLLNSSNYSFIYTISANDGKINTLVDTGNVEPDKRIEIEVYSQTGISKVKEFTLQGVFFKQGLLDNVDPVNNSYNIGQVSFYKIAFFHENEYFQQKALILKTDQNKEMKEAIEKLRMVDFDKVTKIKEQKELKKEYKSPKSQGIEEIDLHIDEILDSTSGMSNAEIVEAQMARFETALQTAVLSNTQKIVFIHGVGNGRLRQELRKRLDRNYSNLKYQDASFKEYGFGATMVYLK